MPDRREEQDEPETFWEKVAKYFPRGFSLNVS